MVNILKRMRGVQPKLLKLRHGRGAALLPPAPAVQLTNVHLAYPVGPYGPAVNGIRLFWRNELQRFKYNNPSLPITVEHNPGTLQSPMTLTLQFESNDREALRSIARKSPNPWKPRGPRVSKPEYEQMSEEEKEALAREQSPNWRDAPSKKETQNTPATPAEGQKKPSADDDEIVLKPQPAADPAAPSTTSPPLPIYTRSVTLGLKGRPDWQIWRWFKMRTQCTAVPSSPEDQRLGSKLNDFFTKAEKDRQRVKAGIDAMKREKEDLKRAREAADRLAADA